MIAIPIEKLLAVAQDAAFFESFASADDIRRQGVQGITDIITIPGIIHRDFADVKAIMAGMARRYGHRKPLLARAAPGSRPTKPSLTAARTGANRRSRGILIKSPARLRMSLPKSTKPA